MLVMAISMVLAAALTRVTLVHTHPCRETCVHKDTSQDFYTFHESPVDYLEMFLPYCESKIKKRNHETILEDLAHSKEKDALDPSDVEEREDHVTQYLAELLVNTDHEITGLQANDHEERMYKPENNEDQSFAFLTGQEGSLEAEGIDSKTGDFVEQLKA